jgi:hypothetical protein
MLTAGRFNRTGVQVHDERLHHHALARISAVGHVKSHKGVFEGGADLRATSEYAANLVAVSWRHSDCLMTFPTERRKLLVSLSNYI